MKLLEQSPKDSKRWMATFADLITLLLTFFVIMLGMAQVDIERFQRAINSLREDRGIVEQDEKRPTKSKADSSVDAEAESKELSFSDLIRIDTRAKVQKADVETDLQQMLDDLEKLIKENDMGSDVSLELSQHGIRLRVKGTLLFDPGSAGIKIGAYRFIDGIAEALNKSEFFLLVEGHTDSTPIATTVYPSNWELSGARASSVIRYLIRKGILKGRLSAVGYADNYPLATNSLAAGRSINRRVEFIFTRYPTRIVI